MEPVVVVDEGLGNSCYLLDLGDGAALVVDPPRDLRAVRAATKGLQVRFVADTHLHADFLSGATQLADDDGAHVLASAAGCREFAHRGLSDGDEIDLGGLTLTAVATPGHTDEHLSFLISDGATVLGVFTGGSLIVGSAARTDLLGEERAEELARAQFRSLRRLAMLPARTRVWPTHGAGSFCSAPAGAERTSTIGDELATNRLLAIADEEKFVAELLGSLGSYPPYFRCLAEINRRGAAVLDPATSGRLSALSPARVDRLVAGGAIVVDVRPIEDYAAEHVAESISIPLRETFATWLGWLVPLDTPVVIVRNPDQDVEEIAWQALKIGHERLAGELDGGFDAWVSTGRPTASTPLVTADQIGERRIVDVRQRSEYVGGHVPGALHIELGAASAVAGRLPDGPIVTMCGRGQRAAGGASLLERAGHRDVVIFDGGAEDLARATGRSLETGG
jgi:hydroxyacylglutathione hydrolase